MGVFGAMEVAGAIPDGDFELVFGDHVGTLNNVAFPPFPMEYTVPRRSYV